MIFGGVKTKHFHYVYNEFLNNPSLTYYKDIFPTIFFLFTIPILCYNKLNSIRLSRVNESTGSMTSQQPAQVSKVLQPAKLALNDDDRLPSSLRAFICSKGLFFIGLVTF